MNYQVAITLIKWQIVH